MTVGGVDDDHVAAGIDEALGPLEARITGGRRGRDPQPALLVLDGAGVGDLLLDVLDRDQADAAVMVVDDEQLLDAELVQQALGLVLRHAFAHGDEPVAGHQLGHRLADIGGEAHVAVRQDADELAAGAVGTALDHRDAGDPVLLHHLEGVGQRLVGVDGDRVEHHARLVLLDEANLLSLLGRLEVAVDHAESAILRHGDGHRRLGDGVHRRRDDRQVEPDRAGETGRDVDLGGHHRGGGGAQQHVVEGEALDDRVSADTGHGNQLRRRVLRRAGNVRPAGSGWQGPVSWVHDARKAAAILCRAWLTGDRSASTQF